MIEEESKHEDGSSLPHIDDDHKMISQQLMVSIKIVMIYALQSKDADIEMLQSKSEIDGDFEDYEENKSEGTIIKECEEALTVEDEEGFEDEIKIMAGLFDSDKKRYQKLLAVLDNHTSPVNCVRWNPLGTLFTSCSDDGSIILWEYVGEMNV